MKDQFPALLHKLCLSLCGENENRFVSQNLVAGFHKCGIVPLNLNEVLSRMPATSADDQYSSSAVHPSGGEVVGASATVSSTVLDHVTDALQRQT